MSRFKEYYADPEFKARCLAHKKEQIECPGCNKMVSRSSYSTHLKSNAHKKKSIKSVEILELEKKRTRIEKRYDKKINELMRIKKCKLEEIN